MFTLFVILLVLKLLGLITIGYFWVFLPLMVYVALIAIQLVAATVSWFLHKRKMKRYGFRL